MARTKLEVTLPKPPALNHLYGRNKNGAKFVKSAGQVWEEECVLTVRSLGLDPFPGPVSLLVHLFTCKRQDNDGILKILMDSLETSGIIANDYQIFDLRVIKHKCKEKEQRIELVMGTYGGFNASS